MAQPQPQAKFDRIVSTLEREAVKPVSAPALLASGVRQLDKELQRRGLPIPNGNPRERLESICQQYPQLSQDGTVLPALVTGAGQALDDPYLSSMARDAFATGRSHFEGQHQPGPGFSIVKDHADQPVKILEVEPDGPSALHSGDLVQALDGHPTASMSVEQARAYLVGEAGSRLHVSLLGGTELDVVRQLPPQTTVEWRVLTQNHHSIGHLRIRTFAATTPTEVDQALNALKESHIQGLIVDLRNNGGGLVTAAVGVCSHFLRSGSRVVTLQRRNGDQVFKTHSGSRLALPVVVLLNHESASASEIVASALHDGKVATLVGTRSFGKGTVQKYLSLGDGSGLKFTSARYRTPAGASIHGIGIAPDVAERGDSLQAGCLLLR